eukprot:14498228-Alexandrium_andersonii.AAC.1
MRRRCRDPVTVAGASRGHAKARGEAKMPGGSWEPAASQAARSTAPTRAVHAACVQKACAR